MRRKEFEKLVAEGFEQLPEWVRKKIKNVALLVEDEPSQEDRKAEGLEDDETLLGLYKGIPLLERGEHYGVGATMPDTITIYQKPIEEAVREECSRYDLEQDDLEQENFEGEKHKQMIAKIVAETIWHEFAHHFGMDEHEVRKREERRDSRKQ